MQDRVGLVALVLLAGCGPLLRDLDGDGLTAFQGDCWDAVEGPPGSGLRGDEIRPDVEDTPYDGFDQDCGGDDDFDLDGDGWVTDPAFEGEPTFGLADSGKLHVGAGDCVDIPAEAPEPEAGFDPIPAEEINPAAPVDTWYDGIDQNCDGVSDFDQDWDGFDSSQHTLGGEDCDDEDDSIHPDATEICDLDEIDEDCDGLINGADDDFEPGSALTWFVDADDDGFGDLGEVTETCDQPEGFVENPDDCNDNDGAIHPDADEYCNGYDDNCDEVIDEPEAVDAPTWYEDADDDTYGDPTDGLRSCDPIEDRVEDSSDCDDTDAAISPAAQEVCDAANIDEDCDNLADDLDDSATSSSFTTFYADADGDGYGSPTSTTAACDLPAGFVADNTDCNDAASGVNPGAQEICDAGNTDEDCDGQADDLDTSTDASTKTTLYRDFDSDSYGNASINIQRCDGSAGYVSDNTDCNDIAASVNPGATEICDASNTDQDCDGLADDNDTSVSTSTYSTFYRDADSDTYGSATATIQRCDRPSGYINNSTDCNDSSASINPGATEVCDASDADEDCDSLADDADSSATGKTSWYQDADSDTYGRSTGALSRCNQPTGYVSSNTDCNDSVFAINPGAAEVCDASNTDEDCDGLADNNDSSTTGPFTTYYLDSDNDDYGVSSSTVQRCDEPSGYASVAGDCLSSNANVNPGEDESCNDSLDNDCDGTLGSRASSAALAECEYSDESLDIAHLIYDSSINNINLGQSVRFVGDISGDGADDLAIGAPAYDPSGATNAGAVYVLTNLDAAGLDYDSSTTSTTASRGVAFTGGGAADYAGSSIAGGNIDTDAASELFVGAPNEDRSSGYSDTGAVYLLNGTSLWSSGGPLSAVGTRGYGSSGDKLGSSLSADGDVDGDGRDDLLAGATQSSGTTIGDGYAVLLTSTTYAASGFTNGPLLRYDIRLEGSGSEAAGYSVDILDADGDGMADMLIGAPYADSGSTNNGRAYLVDGAAASGTVALSGERYLAGTSNAAVAGWAVSSADANGDGYEDALVGAKGTSSSNGAVHIVFGIATVFNAGLISGATLQGSGAEQAGWSVSGAGDTNGDGAEEIVIGASRYSSLTGAVYLVYGPISGTISLASSSSVAQLVGEASGDYAGYSVHGGGDVDDDGYSDVVVGAHESGTSAGSAYLLLGLGQ